MGWGGAGVFGLMLLCSDPFWPGSERHRRALAEAGPVPPCEVHPSGALRQGRCWGRSGGGT